MDSRPEAFEKERGGLCEWTGFCRRKVAIFNIDGKFSFGRRRPSKKT